MFENLCRIIVESGARLVYTATPAIGETLAGFKEEFPTLRSEVSVNEKTAFELALAAAWSGKKAACIFSTRGLLEAMDPLMSAAYTGVKAGFVIACFKEGDDDITQIGLFSKLPTIVSEGGSDLTAAVRYAFDLSGRHEIPCLVETIEDAAPVDGEHVAAAEDEARFVKDPGRWAATPSFRFELHRLLNDKIDTIRAEFERYPGNEVTVEGPTGFITHRASGREVPRGVSLLRLGTVFPLPLDMVSAFVERTGEARIDEGPYPTIELQIRERANVKGRLAAGRSASAAERAAESGDAPVREERLFGFRVVRDVLGPASSLNIAHGILNCGGGGPVLAITDEDAFLHSGMPAFINTLYNGAAYTLVIRAARKRPELERILKGYGFENYTTVGSAEEIKGLQRADAPTVVFYEGTL